MLANVPDNDEESESWELFLTRSHKNEEAGKGLDSMDLVLLGRFGDRKKGRYDPTEAAVATTSEGLGMGSDPLDSKGRSNPWFERLFFRSTLSHFEPVEWEKDDGMSGGWMKKGGEEEEWEKSGRK